MPAARASLLSLYEQGRIANIERNKTLLKGLGLLNEIKVSRRTPSKKRKAIDRTRTPSRQSRRLKGEDTDGKLLPEVPKAKHSFVDDQLGLTYVESGDEDDGYDLALWAARLFKDHKSISGTRAAKCDLNVQWGQHHQHLTLSNDRKIVANTGCAGYGGVVMDLKCKQSSDPKVSIPLIWKVHVLRLGVGGFAVGIGVSNALKRPLKSFGNHPHAWVFHSQGYISHNRIRKSYPESRQKEGGSEGFGQGDILSIILKPHGAQVKSRQKVTANKDKTKSAKNNINTKIAGFWDLFFEIQRPGSPQTSAIPAYRKLSFSTGFPVLICQPYMQGAGKILPVSHSGV
jgi:hypothetical protein